MYVFVYVYATPPPPPPAPHWNETAEKDLGVLADEENTSQENSSRHISPSGGLQKEITLPSRLVYYVNQDSESPYHVLDTKARHQQKHNKVGRGGAGKSGCHEVSSFDLIFCQNLISQILLQHFIRKSISVIMGGKLEGINLGSTRRGMLFVSLL